MERKAAKQLLHIKAWLERVGGIVERGRDAYLADDLLQEAGDSLMMKLGEAANRNFIIHQYDEINRAITWQTLSVDLPAWEASRRRLFADADIAIDDEARRSTTTRDSPAAE
jgi:uncharacterized protein with HEPN domain